MNYIQHDKYHTMKHALNIKAMNKQKSNSKAKEEKDFMELDFGSMPHRLHEELYEGIQYEIVNTTRFDENSDLSMTYLGR